jgi:hypothetical protein
MRPLSVSVDEHWLLGGAYLVLGVAVGAVTLSRTGRPLPALGGLLFGAAFFGGTMYRFVYRRPLQTAVAEAREVTDPVRESTVLMVRRLSIRLGLLTVALAVLALNGRSGAIFGGFSVGNGIAVLVLGRWVRRWENEHGVIILREPRWCWRRENGHSGRGMMDPRDFYFVRTGPK